MSDPSPNVGFQLKNIFDKLANQERQITFLRMELARLKKNLNPEDAPQSFHQQTKSFATSLTNKHGNMSSDPFGNQDYLTHQFKQHESSYTAKHGKLEARISALESTKQPSSVVHLGGDWDSFGAWRSDECVHGVDGDLDRRIKELSHRVDKLQGTNCDMHVGVPCWGVCAWCSVMLK